MITYSTDKLQKVLLGGGCEQRNLPSGYTQVEYIESSGTQYIDTGYKPNVNTSINIKYYPAVSSTFMCLYGVQNSRTLNRFYGLISATQFKVQINSNAGGTESYWGLNKNGTFSKNSNGTFAETQCIVDLTVDNVNKNVSIKSDEYNGDISLSGTVFGDNLNCTHNMLLLSRSTAGTAENSFSGKIYVFSIKDNGVLIQNLIPCRRNSDNVLGMYDTVTGTFFENAGTGTFTAGADVVPTPDEPMDIVCNNGVMKVRHASGLPLGYTLLNYIESSGTQYIDTGVKVNQDFKIELKGIQLQLDVCMFGVSSYLNAFSTTSSNVIYNFCGSSGTATSTTSLISNVHTIAMSKAGGLVIDNTVLVNNFNDATRLKESTYNMALFCRLFNNDGSVQKIGNSRIYYCKLYNGNTLIRNFIPAKNSSNVLGMYDTVTNTFFTNAGTGTFIAGYTITDPIEIYTDGTQEVVTDNLGNTANAEMLLAVGDYKDKQSVLDGVVTRNVGIKVLDGSEDWVKSTASGVGSLFYFESATNINYLSTSAAVCTHYIGELPNISGGGQNNKSIKAGYSGLSVTYNKMYIKDNSFNTLEAFTDYLASQYAAGTPVIIVYPLAEPTTEHVTPQPLAGSSATVTAGSIDNLPIVTDNITKLKSRFITDANGEVQEVKRVYIGDNLVYSAEIEEQS